MQYVQVKRHFAAPVERVFDRYTDHASWTRWAGLGNVRLGRAGAPEANGTGAVRVISAAGVEVHEEVMSFDRPRRMTYTVVKGPVPMKDHLGEVIFETDGEGTLVTWRCRFASRIPGLGRLQRWYITRIFAAALRGLADDLARVQG